jgi:hypothetical protein
MNTTSNSSYKSLVHAANEWRKSVVQKIWGAIRVVNGAETKVVTDENIIGSIFADFLSIAHKPTEKAFANSDIQYFIDLYQSKKDWYDGQIADLHSQKGSWVRDEITKRSILAKKCNTVLNILNEEKSRRIAEKQAAREAEQAAHQVWLDSQREKYTAIVVKPHYNRPVKTIAIARNEKVIGNSLEALVVVKTEFDAIAAQNAANAIIEARKQGKFVSERFVKKAELAEIIGQENLEKVYSTGSYTLPDYRLVEVKKSGAVTRFLLKE